MAEKGLERWLEKAVVAVPMSKCVECGKDMEPRYEDRALKSTGSSDRVAIVGVKRDARR